MAHEGSSKDALSLANSHGALEAHRQLQVGQRTVQVHVTEWIPNGDRPSAATIPPRPPQVVAPGSQQQPQQSSPLASALTMCNSAIGVGVLALPYAFKLAGLVGGVILCVLIGAIEGFTLYVLSKFAERYESPTFGALIRRALGRKLMVVTAIVMVVYLFGSCVVYLMIVRDTCIGMAARWLGPESLLASRTKVTFMIAGGVLLPLCLLRRLGHLASLSMLAIAGFVYTAAVIVGLGVQHALARPEWRDDIKLFNWNWEALLYAVPIFVFGFNCHSNVVTIFVELDEDSKPLLSVLPRLTRRNRTAKLVSMVGVIAMAILFTMTGYVLVGVAGYVGWPYHIDSNVLNVLPGDLPVVQVAHGLIGFVVLCHYPLTHHPARSAFKDCLVLWGWPRPPPLLSNLFTLAFVGGTTVLAVWVASLGDVLHIIGGTCASFLMAGLPGLLLINAAIKKRSKSLLDLYRQDPASAEDMGLNEPLLQEAVEKGIKGIKRTGLIYSPGKSWVAGVALVVLSALLVAVTGITLLRPAD